MLSTVHAMFYECLASVRMPVMAEVVELLFSSVRLPLTTTKFAEPHEVTDHNLHH